MTAELEPALAALAREHAGPDARVEGLERLVGGASRELWGFGLVEGGRRRELVLRRDPEGVGDPEGRRREFEVLAAVHRHGVRGPEPFWFVEGEGEAGGTGIVMERLEGESIARRILRDDRFARARERVCAELAAAAAATHSVPLDEVPVGGPESDAAQAGIGFLEAQLDALGEPHPALELGLRWLRRNLPEPRSPTLVHGDLRLGNILVDEEGLAGVLDWELAHVGSPVEDLGWMCIRSWRFGADDKPAAGFGSRDELLEAYQTAGGAAVSREELRFWEVMGNVRWGVICVMQADVHLSGKRPSLEHAAIGRRTCEPEWDLLAMLGP